MAASQVEVVGPEGGAAVNFVHMHAELIEWSQVLTYTTIAFGTVILLIIVAVLVTLLIRS